MLKDGTLVIDAVAHAFNLARSNFAHEEHAAGITEMIWGVVGASPAGYAISESDLKRDWPIEDTAGMLFRESATDLAIYHATPIFAYKDGLSAFEKGLEAVRRWPQRFVGCWASVDPLRGPSALATFEEQAAALRDLGHVPFGLKLYPTSWRGDTVDSWRMDDPKVAFPLYERAQRLGVKTIGVHKAIPLGAAPTGAAFNPVDVEGAAAAFPDLNFEIVHGGAAFCEETAWLLSRYPNVYVNLETMNIILVKQPRAFARILLSLCNVGGAGMLSRMFWGTGTMQYHPRPCLEALECFEYPPDMLGDFGLFGPIPQMTARDRAGILGGNLAACRGWDLDALRNAIKGDEFDKGPPAEPYSMTSIARDASFRATPA